MVYISEKIDGQNSRYVTTFDTEPQNFESATALQTHAGSRTEWKKKEGGSNWWRALDQNPWIEKWIQSNSEQVLYGEIFGWVQSLKYGANKVSFFSVPLMFYAVWSTWMLRSLLV